jgi:hypothetical protein
MNKVTVGNAQRRTHIGGKPDASLHAWAHRMVIAGANYVEEHSSRQPLASPSVVIVYNDIHAALRAAEAVERLGSKFRDRGRQWLMPVPVAQLKDANRFDRLLADASSADMIIVSFNGAGDFPEPLKKWIANCLLQQREGHAAVVAMLSSNEKLDPPDSPRYQFFKNAAWAAGLAFVEPRAGEVETDPSKPAKL